MDGWLNYCLVLWLLIWLNVNIEAISSSTEAINSTATTGYTLAGTAVTAAGYTVSVFGQEVGYTLKYTPSPSGVPLGFALRNSFRQRGIFDSISRVES